jgi:hypothetical protein
MKIEVYDTYTTSRAGIVIHFDVFLPIGGSLEQALHFARAFLNTINESPESLKSVRCSFCHTQAANPAIIAEIEKSGHYILQMEGCPTPYR